MKIKVVKRLMWICTPCAVVFLGAFMYLRHHGVPVCVNRGCSRKLGWCYMLSKAFGQRSTFKYESGQIMNIEVRHGVKPCTSIWRRYDDAVLDWGKYYSPAGTLISSVKDGHGVATYSFDSGEPEWITTYESGKSIKQIHYHKNGQKRRVSESNQKGYLVKLIEWYDNGQLKKRLEYDGAGKKLSEEYFDIKGNAISEEELRELNETTNKKGLKGRREPLSQP